MGKRQLILTIVGMAMSLAAHGQATLDAAHNQVRDYDEQTLHVVSGCREQVAEDGRFVLDMTEATISERTVARRYRTDIAEDTLTTIVAGNRTYYTQRGDTLLLAGMENVQTRIVYDWPEEWLRLPMALGDTLEGYYHGTGGYCENLFLRKFGHYRTEADAAGRIVLPSGETLENALRLHTVRYLSTVTAPIDTLRRKIPAFTADSIERHVEADSALLREDIRRYYARGYRYPVVELTTVASGREDGRVFFTQTWYYAPEEQRQLALDEANMAVRRADGQETDGEDAAGRAAGDKDGDGGVSYAVSVDTEARTITVSYESATDTDVVLRLSNVQGVVYKSASGRDVNRQGNVVLNYGDLRRGEYILHVFACKTMYSEVFNVK